MANLQPFPVRVLLVEDHRLFRQGLRQLLEEHGHRVVAEAPTAREGVRLASECRPDVIVLDLQLPGTPGLDAIPAFLEAAPGTRILVMTASSDERDVMEALASGAVGYMLKDASVEEILAGIRAAASGDSALSPVIARKLVQHLRQAARDRPPADEPAAPALTDREADVLRLVAAGRENAEIAAELFVSVGTVKGHVASLLQKLGVENRVQAAAEAVRRGLA